MRSLQSVVAVKLFAFDLEKGRRKVPASSPSTDADIAWLHVTDQTRNNYMEIADEVIETIEEWLAL